MATLRTPRASRQGFTCPGCGYDLRGQPVKNDVLQCPECGSVTDLTTLRRSMAARARIPGRLMADAVMILVAIGLAVISNLIFEDAPESMSFSDRIEFVTSGAGIAIAIALTAMYVAMTYQWEVIEWDERLAGGVAIVCVLLLAPEPWSFALSLLLFFGLQSWAAYLER